MNSRQARRVACARAAHHIKADLDAGGFESDPDVNTPGDVQRLYEALRELQEEMLRRAGDKEQEGGAQ